MVIGLAADMARFCGDGISPNISIRIVIGITYFCPKGTEPAIASAWPLDPPKTRPSENKFPRFWRQIVDFPQSILPTPYKVRSVCEFEVVGWKMESLQVISLFTNSASWNSTFHQYSPVSYVKATPYIISQSVISSTSTRLFLLLPCLIFL